MHTVSRMVGKPGWWRVVFLTGERAYDVFLDLKFGEALSLAIMLNGGDRGGAWIPDPEWAEEHASR